MRARPDPVYLDNNATTPMDPRVLEAMLPLLSEQWGNPSSPHQVGRPVTKAVARARHAVAELVGATAGEIVFTASATEADNLAIRGVVRATRAAGRPAHVVTTAVEHPAVLETCRDLAGRGECDLTVLGVDRRGNLDPDELESALRPGATCLVSVMWANNETGVVFPIEEIGHRVRRVGACFHVDAVQAMGKVDVDFRSLPVDLLAMSGHKMHGPKGMGALVVRRGVDLHPVVTGGGQERGRRSGTENPAGIVGLATALELALAARGDVASRVQRLRDRLQAELQARIPSLRVTGEQAPRIPNTLHVTVPDVEAEPILLLLDREGVACSSGSACSSGALEPSHVLTAMGVPAERLHGALRFSLSRMSCDRDVDRVVSTLPSILERVGRITNVARG
jgi:cysteine desulfurase